MASILLAAYHLIIFFWYFFVSSTIFMISADDRPTGVFLYGGQWKYLTVLNLVLQTIFYGVSFLNDIFRLTSKVEGVKQMIHFRDLLFSILVFPVGTFVVASFWVLYIYNRELVYPESLDGFIPVWLNHAMHTSVLPLILLETLLTPHRYPVKSTGLTTLGFFSLAYLSWILWIYAVVGEWVYPILGMFSAGGLVAFISISNVGVVALYMLGENLNRMIWGGAEHKLKRK
ncbi:androgen-dependent TFPI-regulating protein [Latimeria chalumnae]|uniref:Androgen dependent TFPI regulating protein n=1 Tax=Latimeria chalumnae TaxID=7897 RepID=M3XK67_LATCH|nr:PREDICTED: androgen-dependent TFPI-regulating protein isoform X2 [Latimeria chalumnae]|eukprot:XP_014350551.1 PREDICTED: androgen-dependent TFPI-regulating protein isoform X2 [Latimeria chalumnae]